MLSYLNSTGTTDIRIVCDLTAVLIVTPPSVVVDIENDIVPPTCACELPPEPQPKNPLTEISAFAAVENTS